MKRRLWSRLAMACPALMLVMLFSGPAGAYSVLTHEAIIDSAWDDSIRPLLLKRFPGSSEEDLRKAHAYAYGGAIIQDMGYYPFASKFFSDLVHYVRSGDFVEAMLRDSSDINEYAFALGGLAHYAADNIGHPLATNRSVPLLYPKLRARYGNDVTYAEDPPAHLKTEFGFDVIQVARGNYAPKSYHDFIGFEVSKPLLERAFKETYGIELKDAFTSLDLALGTYRRSVSGLIPEATRLAWVLKKDEIMKAEPGMTRQKFLYNLSQSSYEKEWGTRYQRPGAGTRLLAFVIRVIPKVGPFKSLAFRPPTTEAEKYFMESFNKTLSLYRESLSELLRSGRIELKDMNFDTGQPTRAGDYTLADKAYAELLGKLADHKFQDVSPELRRNILAFYSNLNAPITTKRDPEDWQKTLQALGKLQAEQR